MGSIFILFAEAGRPDANITTASDAIWWAYVTITTVGYGDHFPVTFSGRPVGMLLLTAGVGLFGVLTGFLANAFLAPRKKKQAEYDPDSDDPKVKIAQIRELPAEHEKRSADLRSKLEEIEELL